MVHRLADARTYNRETNTISGLQICQKWQKDVNFQLIHNLYIDVRNVVSIKYTMPYSFSRVMSVYPSVH